MYAPAAPRCPYSTSTKTNVSSLLHLSSLACQQHADVQPSRHALRGVLLRSAVACGATGRNEAAFNRAASEYARGVEQGRDADDLVAESMGLSSKKELNKVQEEYKAKIREKLEERAREMMEEEAEAREVFDQGKDAYSHGEYAASLELFEQALAESGPASQLGGDIQMWLALSYQAMGREEDCIELYKRLEKQHPIPNVRRQAEHLRFIMEAPKLKLGEDERVKIPVLDLDRNLSQRGLPSRPRRLRPTPAREPTLEERFLLDWKPPTWTQNRYVQVASTVLAVLLIWYSIVYK